MIHVVESLVPVFALIAMGAVMRRLQFPGDAFWPLLERVTYFILFPCLLFRSIVVADFAGQPLGALGLVLGGAMVVMAILTIPLKPLLKLDGPSYTSVFQGSVRWNSFVAIGSINAVYGQGALVLAAVAIAVMVPIANALAVAILMRHGENGQSGMTALFKQLVQNPLIIACAVGIAVKLVGLPMPDVLLQTTDMLGKASLVFGLFAVGASLDFGDARARPMPVATATVLKLIGMPLLVMGGAWIAGLESAAWGAALICGAVPGASSSYILARLLGGDAPLMANITTAQTLGAMVTMPLLLWVFA